MFFKWWCLNLLRQNPRTVVTTMQIPRPRACCRQRPARRAQGSSRGLRDWAGRAMLSASYWTHARGLRGLGLAPACPPRHWLRSPASPGSYQAWPVGLKAPAGNGLPQPKSFTVATTRELQLRSEAASPAAFSEPDLAAYFRDSAHSSHVSAANPGPSAASPKNGCVFSLNSACVSSCPAFLFFQA